MNSGNLPDSTLAKSSKIAVVPPTRIVTPVPLVAPGITSLRMWLSSAVVDFACGEPDWVDVGDRDGRPTRAGRA